MSGANRFGRVIGHIVVALKSSAFEFPIATLFAIRAIVASDLKWGIAAILVALLELGILLWMQGEYIRSVISSAERIFDSYTNYEFRRIALRLYLKINEPAFAELYRETAFFSFAVSIKRAYEGMTEPGFPTLIYCHRVSEGPLLSSVTSLTESTGFGCIFLPNAPWGSSSATGFFLLHEIGHHSRDSGNLPHKADLGIAYLRLPLMLVFFPMLFQWTIATGIAFSCALFLHSREIFVQYEELAWHRLAREIHADKFALDRTSIEDCIPLLTLFDLYRKISERAEHVDELDSLRWYFCWRNCRLRVANSDTREWSGRDGRSGRINLVLVPFLWVILARSEWPFTPSHFICCSLAAAGTGIFSLAAFRYALLRNRYEKTMKERAPRMKHSEFQEWHTGYRERTRKIRERGIDSGT